MKILCVSDTHGDSTNLKEVIKSEKEIDLLFHAGDKIIDVEPIQNQDFNIVKVKGNRDFQYEEDLDKIINIKNKKILLTHGHKYRVKYGLTNLSYKAQEIEADIVIFGHTHRSLKLEQDSILYLNPGSLVYPRDGFASYGIIEVRGEEAIFEIKSF